MGEQNLLKANYLRNLVGVLKLLLIGIICHDKKLLGQAIVAGSFAYAGLQFPDKNGLTPISMNLSTVRDTSIKLGMVLVIIWVILMVLGTSNGVNLTDGLDGLATGAAVMVFTSFILIGVWEFGQSCAVSPGLKCYEVRDPLDLAVLAAALAGACGGFLEGERPPRAGMFRDFMTPLTVLLTHNVASFQ